MRKIAIFVEGHTELLFVRDYILKQFGYSNDICVESYSLLDAALPNPPTHGTQSNPNNTHFFALFLAENDNKVLTSALAKANKFFVTAQYDYILCLRDMYSEVYEKKYNAIFPNQNPKLPDETLNKEFIEAHLQIIESQLNKAFLGRFFLCFSIMEIEAWFLGMYDFFQRIDATLTTEYIRKKTPKNYNLLDIDPETEFFKPANVMEEIYKLVGKKYKKNQPVVSDILNTLTKADFNMLLSDNTKCASFTCFCTLFEALVS